MPRHESLLERRKEPKLLFSVLCAHAWAYSCGCKSRHKLITANEVKRNCVRVPERGEEAWSVNREPMNKNCIEGVAKQGERAANREALVIKVKRRRCSGCAMKGCVLTWGALVLYLKG
jgi:hypothetical protein